MSFDVATYSEERKKKKREDNSVDNNSNTFDVATYSERRKINKVVTNDWLNDYQRSVADYYKGSSERYNNSGYTSFDTDYENNSSDYAKIQQKNETLRNYLKYNKGYISEESYNALNDYLKQVEESGNELTNAYNRKRDFFGQFKDENEYNAYERNESFKQKYADKTYQDMMAEYETADEFEKNYIDNNKYSKMTDDELEAEKKKLTEDNKNGTWEKVAYALNLLKSGQEGGNDDKLSRSEENVKKHSKITNQIENIDTELNKRKKEEAFKLEDKNIGDSTLFSLLDFVNTNVGISGADASINNIGRSTLKENGYTDEEIDRLADLKKLRDNVDLSEDIVSETKNIENEFVKSFVAGSMNLAGGVLSTPLSIIGADENTPLFALQKAGQAADESIMQNHDWDVSIFGNDIDLFDQAYQVGMGVRDNLMRMVVAGGDSTIAGALMGAEVLPSAYTEAKEKGYSTTKAIGMAGVQAAIEALTEKYSVETILGDSKGFFSHLGKSFLAEGSEEVASNISNRLADVLVNTSENEIMQKYNDLRYQGKTEAEALTQIFTDMLGEDFDSFVIGGLSGAALGAGADIANRVKSDVSNNAIKNYEINKYKNELRQESVKPELLELAKQTASPETYEAYEQARNSLTEKPNFKLTNELKKSSKALAKEIRNNISAETTEVMNNAIKDSLQVNKISENQIESVIKYASNQNLNEADIKNIQSIDAEVLDNALKSGANAADLDYSQKIVKATKSSNSKKAIDIGSYSTDGVGEADGIYYNGNKADIISFSNAKNGEVKLSNGDTVNVSDLEMSSKQATVIEGLRQIAEKYSIGNDDATILYEMATGTLDSDTDTYNLMYAVDDAIRLGSLGVKSAEKVLSSSAFINAVSQNAIAKNVIDKAYNIAYKASETVKLHDSQISNAIKGKGKLNYDKSITEKGLKNYSREQRAHIAVAESLSKVFSNKITVYDSENVSGDMQWAKTKNGSFRSQDGTIWIDINAQQGVLGALSHELTHMVSLLDESTFKKISEILIDEYADLTKTKSVEDYIREYEERLNLGTKAAYEEFVADCMTNMLTDTNAAETIVKLRNTMNEKAQNRFIKLINDTIRSLKSFVKRSNAIEAASITSQLKSLQKISELWAQGVSNTMTEFEKTENKGKTVEIDKYSVKYTDKNNPVVVVNDDIIRGVLNDKELVKVVKKSLSKFKYVPIDKQKIYFTTDTKKETTYSQYTKWLRNNKADVYQDKMRLLNHPVDVILATTNYVNEGLKHPRKDNIVDFARGNLLLDIIGNKYEADVVIGFTKYGMCELHDIVNMKPTTFEYKKEASYKDSSSKKGLSQKGNASFNNIISTNTGKSQEKFSLKTNVEETKDLIAVHNLTEANLLKSLELGGLPMPSIAIIKAKSNHSRYGDISLVFNKSTIDPEASRYNKVYGGDAWTPTYPAIEYKANEKVADKIHKLYYDLAKKYGYDEARPLYNLAENLEDELNRRNGEAGLIDYYKDDTSLMNLYLVESGKDKVQPVINEVRTEMSEAESEQSEYLIKALGKDIIDEFKVNNDENPLKHRKAYIEKNGEKIKEAYRQLMSEEYGFSDEQISNVLKQTRMFDYIKMIRTAYNYLHGNTVSVKTETDRAATDRAIKKAAGEGYTKWLNDLLNGAEEKSGIRNNVDYFTPMGNRRSFEALHWENNLENVVKAMREESATGNASIFSGLGIWGVSAKNYKSIEEIKSDKNRLSQMDEEEHEKIKRDFGERLNDIAFKIMDKTEQNQFIAMDNAQECIVDAVRSSKTKSGILKNLKQYQQLNVTEADVDDIVELVGEISNMPTEYFEAKPQRAVGFNEVATAIIPNNSSNELKTALNEKGVAYREYEAGNEEARAQVLNSLEDVKFSEKLPAASYENVIKSLEKDNAALREDINDLKELVKVQGKVTHGEVFTKTSVEAVAKKLARDFGMKGGKTELVKMLNEYYSSIASSASDSNLNFTDVMENALPIARYINENIPEVNVLDEQAQEILDYLKTSKISLNELQKQEVASAYDSYNNYRKSLFGNTVLSDGGTPLDIVWKDLSERFPSIFDEDTNPNDMPIVLKDAIEAQKSNFSDNNEWYAEERVQEISQAVYDGYWRASTLHSVADKYQTQINRLKSKHMDKMTTLRENRDKRIANIKAKNTQSRKNAIEKRNVTVERHKVKAKWDYMYGLLTSPTKERNIGTKYQKFVRDMLLSIEPDISADGERGNRTRARLQEQIQTLKGMSFDSRSDFTDEVVQDIFEKIKEPLMQKGFKGLNSTELNEVNKALRATRAVITNEKKLFLEGREATVSGTAKAVTEEVKHISKQKNERITKIAGIDIRGVKRFALDLLKPEYAFRYVGSNEFNKLFKEAQKGDNTMARDIEEADKFCADIEKKYNAHKWKFDKQVATVGELPLKLGELMSLYAYSRREAADLHLSDGGIATPDSLEKKVKGVKVETERIQTDRVRLDKSTVQKLTDKLTKDQKAFVEEMQKYLSETMAAKGNEVSQALYEIDLFTEKNYFPLKVDSEFLAKDMKNEITKASLKSSGMTKATIKNANKPIVLENFIKVWSGHVAEMSMYHSYVLGIENLVKVFNYTDYLENTEHSESVRSVISAAYGKEMTAYLDKFLVDLNGGVNNNYSSFSGKAFSKFKKTAVAASLSVAIQQPMAIVRAMSYINPQYFVKIPKHILKTTWTELKKHSGIAVLKEIGGFDIGNGRGPANYLKNNFDKSFGEKFDDGIMYLAGKGDEIGWSIIWNAAKAETAKKFPQLKGEALLKKAGERFDEVVSLTQVYDSTFSRSGIMRSNSDFNKMATSFMGEPITSLNMYIDAAVQSNRGKIGKMQAARIIGSVILAQVLGAAAKSLIYAGRDDADDKSYGEKYFEQFGGAIADEINPLNLIPIVRDIWSLLSGNDVERPDMTQISNFLNAIDKLNSDDRSTYRKIEDFAGAIAAIFGIPVKNVMRDMRAIYNTCIIAPFDENEFDFDDAAELFVEGFFDPWNNIASTYLDRKDLQIGAQDTGSTAVAYIDRGKIEKGKEVINELVNEKVESGKTEKQAKSAVRSSFTSEYKQRYIEAYNDKDDEEMLDIRRKLQSTGLYDDVSRTCQEWIKSSKSAKGGK